MDAYKKHGMCNTLRRLQGHMHLLIQALAAQVVNCMVCSHACAFRCANVLACSVSPCSTTPSLSTSIAMPFNQVSQRICTG